MDVWIENVSTESEWLEIWNFPGWKCEDPPTNKAFQDLDREGKLRTSGSTLWVAVHLIPQRSMECMYAQVLKNLSRTQWTAHALARGAVAHTQLLRSQSCVLVLTLRTLGRRSTALCSFVGPKSTCIFCTPELGLGQGKGQKQWIATGKFRWKWLLIQEGNLQGNRTGLLLLN